MSIIHGSAQNLGKLIKNNPQLNNDLTNAEDFLVYVLIKIWENILSGRPGLSASICLNEKNKSLVKNH